jgi:hypothetical protein
MWFRQLTGFDESPEAVARLLRMEGETLRSLANGRSFHAGRLETPSLQELRERSRMLKLPKAPLRFGAIAADVRELHRDPAGAGALFQVASQFNLLEMVSPDVPPEAGIDRYDRDPTQGPACAVACGAGTIYRRYFVPLGGPRPGQSAERQIDTLADLGRALGNDGERLWQMRNGYALATAEGLERISRRLESSNEGARDALRQLLRIGIQWETEVTLEGAGHRVSQAYCSALPVVYSPHPPRLWEPFARLVLEAAYEATLHAALLNLHTRGDPRVYLTLLGGGAFGNDPRWILEGMERALERFADTPLEVWLVRKQ